jgi:hypothetical protein
VISDYVQAQALLYLQWLVEQAKYDWGVLSQPWLWYWALVPAFFYAVFAVCKWVIMLLPVWLPLRFALMAVAVLIRAFRGR